MKLIITSSNGTGLIYFQSSSILFNNFEIRTFLAKAILDNLTLWRGCFLRNKYDAIECKSYMIDTIVSILSEIVNISNIVDNRIK